MANVKWNLKNYCRFSGSSLQIFSSNESQWGKNMNMSLLGLAPSLKEFFFSKAGVISNSCEIYTQYELSI